MAILTDITFTIPKETVLVGLKYNKRRSASNEQVDEIIDNMISEGYVLAEPRISYKDFIVKKAQGSTMVLEETDYIIPGKSVVEHLRGSYKVSLFLCTIGNAMENAVKRFLAEGELTKAAVLDVVASETVEAVVDQFNAILEQNARFEGACLTRRYSTGYGDWHVAEQRKLVEVLDGEEIGVSVNDSSLMIPEKSVSACVGWKKDKPAPIRNILKKKNNNLSD